MHVFLANKQVRKRRQYAKPILILGQAAVSDFVIDKDAFDLEERVLDLGSHR